MKTIREVYNEDREARGLSKSLCLLVEFGVKDLQKLICLCPKYRIKVVPFAPFQSIDLKH